VLADEVLQLRPDNRALGLPQHQPLPNRIIDGEQPELRAEEPVVALLRLFELVEVLVELLLVEERGAVDALEFVGAHVAVPVRLRHAHHLEPLDPPGRRDMRAHAQVFPVLTRLARGVPAQGPRPPVDRPPRVVHLVLVPLALQALHSRLDRQLVTGERPILLHDLRHLPLDPRKIVGGDRRVQRDVVIEPVLQRRAVRQLRLRPKPLDRLGHHVRGRVPQHHQRLAVAVGQDGDGVVAAQLRGEIHHFAVHLAGDGGLGQSLADRLGQLRHGAAVGHLFDRSVWEFDVGHEQLSVVGSNCQKRRL
jgi:hypothetical protein